MTWRDRAACAGMDTELFVHDYDRPKPEAVAVCAGCPVQAECAQYAVDLPGHRRAVVGTWGGQHNEAIWRQRIALIGSEPRNECGTLGAYRRHQRYGETPCGACKEARHRYDVRRGKAIA
ncbi:MAG TPA: WhiB family transcriptional regulator [Acidimicrobiia bacterium]